ncbi:MAG: LacI family DNA-binding transcriptional regulator [Lachnospiraceae bacterium]|nr:LacI family DNA-binding transcriptional regulator [Lachnospiraceae bacterium]
MVSMKDIAAACGVSVATVSKALNDHADISEDTKKSVRRMAREMGYFPNSVARALKTNKTYNIGVLFVEEAHSGLTHDFFAHVLDSFKRTVEQQGYDITFLNCNKSRPNPMSYLEHSRYRGFDGVVIACVNFEDPEVIELLESDLPVVAIDCECETKTSVLSDNEAGISQLMDYARELGHERIAYITGKDSAVTKARVHCYKEKLKEFGLPVREEYIVASEYRDIGQTAMVTTELLAMPEIPTCILFPDDYAAYGGINVIRGMGMKIPEDISVAGYDGISLAAQIQPRLTTVRQDTELMGKTAAEKLIQIIENPGQFEKETVTVKGKLIKGETFARNPEI